MSLLLASVSDVDEAMLVGACGADWIDVKDPGNGALGAAPIATVRAIVRQVGGRLPVSATIGDCWGSPELIAPRVQRLAHTGIDYAKAPLDARDVDSMTLAGIAAAKAAGVPLIVVCMAERPPRSEDIDALAAVGVAGVMLDTADKQGPRLPELLPAAALAEFVARGRAHGLLVGLAGRLSAQDVPGLVALGADYLGFRSALCPAAARSGRIGRAETAVLIATLRACTVTTPPSVRGERHHGMETT